MIWKSESDILKATYSFYHSISTLIKPANWHQNILPELSDLSCLSYMSEPCKAVLLPAVQWRWWCHRLMSFSLLLPSLTMKPEGKLEVLDYPKLWCHELWMLSLRLYGREPECNALRPSSLMTKHSHSSLSSLVRLLLAPPVPDGSGVQNNTWSPPEKGDGDAMLSASNKFALA